jgi:hypothetical protein
MFSNLVTMWVDTKNRTQKISSLKGAGSRAAMQTTRPNGCLATLTKNHIDSAQNLTNRTNQPIKQNGNHRGWCVPQRTTTVPQRTRLVAHRGQGLLPTEDKKTNQQTWTDNPDQTKTRTKAIYYHSNLGRIPDSSWPWAQLLQQLYTLQRFVPCTHA